MIVPKLFIKPSSAIIGPGEAVTLPQRLERHSTGSSSWPSSSATRGRDIPLDQGARLRRPATRSSTTSPRARCSGASPGASRADFDASSTGSTASGATGSRPSARGSPPTDSVTPTRTQLEMTLKVNDKVWQNGSTADMIFSPAEIIAFASRFMTLEPGDVIAAGTLDGTGDAAGMYLKAGDVMDGSIGELGTLVTPVVAAIGLTMAEPVAFGVIGIRVHGPDLGPGHRQSRPRGAPGGGRRRPRRRRTWPPSTASTRSTSTRLFGRDDIDAVVIATPVPQASATRRGRGARRQARARREADDQHPGRCRCDGRRRRRRRRPPRRRLAAPVPGGADGRQGRSSRPGGSATSG